VLCDSQFGFCANWSTTSLLLAIMHDWAKMLNDHLSSHWKAFDYVPHKRLLLNWNLMESMDHCYSSSIHLLQYIVKEWLSMVIFLNWAMYLQVFLRGPLLFILYINDLPSVVKSKIKIITDDPNLYRKTGTLKNCVMLQEDLNHVSNWCQIRPQLG